MGGLDPVQEKRLHQPHAAAEEAGQLQDRSVRRVHLQVDYTINVINFTLACK